MSTSSPTKITTSSSSSSSSSSNAFKSGTMLPLSSSARYSTLSSTSPSTSSTPPKQCHTVPITHYKTEWSSDTAGKLISVNDHLIVYAIKGGMIRVIEQHAALRTLLRGHTSPVLDVSFFSRTSDVLGSVGADGTIIIWRIFDRDLEEPDPETQATKEITYEKLLQIDFPASRLVWHPVDPNKFLIVYNNTACLVESTKLVTTRHTQEGHAICLPSSLQSDPNALTSLGLLMTGHTKKINDICFSAKAQYAVTASDDGSVKVWHLTSTIRTSTSVPCVKSFSPNYESPVTKVFFTGRDSQDEKNDLITAGLNNSELTLWSSPIDSTPDKLQTLTFDNGDDDGDLYMNIVMDDSREFISVCDTKKAMMYVVHVVPESLKTTVNGLRFDYITPFKVMHPILSWVSVNMGLDSSHQDHDSDAITEEKGFEINLFCVQTTAIQQMKVKPSGCYLEEWVKGRVPSDPLPLPLDLEVSPFDDLPTVPALPSLPSLPSLPVPVPVAVAPPVAPPADPFANWLGAIIGSPPTFVPPAPVEVIAATAKPVPIPVPAPVPVAKPRPLPEVTVNAPAAPLFDAALLSPSTLLAKIAFSPTPPSQSPSPTPKAAPEPPVIIAAPIAPVPVASPTIQSEKKSIAPSTSGFSSSPPTRSASDLTVEDVTAAFKSVMVTGESKIGLSQSYEQKLLKTLTKTIESSIQNTIVPKLTASIKTSNEDAVFKPLQLQIASQLTSEMQKVGKAVTRSVKEDGEKMRKEFTVDIVKAVRQPIVEVFAQTMQEVLIPAFEVGMKQMFIQVNDTLSIGLANINNTNFNDGAADTETSDALKSQSEGLKETNRLLHEQNRMLKSQLEGMTSAMTAMAMQMEKFQNVVTTMAVSGAKGPAKNGSAAAAPQVEKEEKKLLSAADLALLELETTKQNILAFIEAKRFEDSFTIALGASNIDIALFTCKNCVTADVFSDDGCKISQTVLLCLMQQLGSSVAGASTDFKLECDWLQEIAVTIDPNDAAISSHIKKVLSQLTANIATAIDMIKDGSPLVSGKRKLNGLLRMIRGVATAS